MKKSILACLLLGTFLCISAQEKAWEIKFNDYKLLYTRPYTDFVNPDIISMGGQGGTRVFDIDKGELLFEIKDLYSWRSFWFTNEKYSFIYTGGLKIYRGGIVENTPKNLFKELPSYSSLISVRQIDGALYILYGGGDAYNKRPKKSKLFIVNDRFEHQLFDVALPSLNIDKVVEARGDKGHFVHTADWHEVYYNPMTFDVVVCRVTSFDTNVEIGLFTINLKSREVFNEVKLEIPNIPKGHYIHSSFVSPVHVNGRDEFIVQLMMCPNNNTAQVINPIMLIIRYNIDGVLTGSQQISFVEFTEYTQKTIDIRKYDYLSMPQYDVFADEYVFVTNYPNNNNLNYSILNKDFKQEKAPYPNGLDRFYKNGPKPTKPSNLPVYWDYFYDTSEETKMPGTIFFGKDYVLVMHASYETKKTILACFR